MNFGASPKELGMSRADIWAFAGLLAIDEYLKFTRSFCNHFEGNYTCGDPTYECFTTMPKLENFFKTGRRDCEPKENATNNNQYLASKVEVHPEEGGNGQWTVDYFEKNFQMNPQETLALMGAHTIGNFNPMTAKIDYAWVRPFDGKRNKMFTNEYFKVISLK